MKETYFGSLLRSIVVRKVNQHFTSIKVGDLKSTDLFMLSYSRDVYQLADEESFLVFSVSSKDSPRFYLSPDDDCLLFDKKLKIF
ncbi:hypothetical protein CA265_09415 [Sphingobacteriaceae bacterium GW460-11-11-14-LB5]|nr:hypothetical protein CA265_09415 [Sphingobacteriaceae bacterium GW460-11-11-14-LB5]